MKRLTLLAFLLLLGGWSAKAQTAPGQTVGVITATGSTCATAGACVIAPLNNSTGSVGVSIANTFSGTVQFEVTTDNSNWVSVNCFPPSSTTAVTSTTAAGTWTCAVNGMVFFRARASAYSSGIIGVVITPSAAINASSVNGGGGGGGSVQPGAIHTPAIYTAANVVGPTPNCTPPSTNGTYDLLFDITASATTDVSCPQEGLAGTPGLTGATSTYPIAYSDNAQAVVHDAAGSAAIVVTLPTPTTLGNQEFVTSYCNYSAFIDTITPTTWTINGQTSLTVPTNTCYRISVDPNNTALSKTNWIIGPAGPVINGISYSNLYPGATLDVRVNACIVDAETLAHGNASGICDSTGEPATQTIAAQINVGDTSQDTVVWKIGKSCAWSANSSIGSTNWAIFQYSNTTIDGLDSQPYRCRINNNAGALGIEGLYTNAGVMSGDSAYYRAGGFGLVNAVTTGSGFVAVITATTDDSWYHDIGISNNSPTMGGGEITNACCGTAFYRMGWGSNYLGGTPMTIVGTNGNDITQITLYDSSITHPVSGAATLKITDSTNHQGKVALVNTYIEPSNSDTTTAPIQIVGFGSVDFYGLMLNAIGTTSTATGITVTNAFATQLNVHGMYMLRYTFPANAIVNSSTSETIATSSNGFLGQYVSNNAYATNYVAGSSIQDNGLAASTIICTDASKVLSTSGCPAAGANYQTIQQAGTPLAQEPVLNFPADMSCTDNPGVATNCTPSSTGGTAFSALTTGVSANAGNFGFSAANGAASTFAFGVTGTPFTGGSATTTFPFADIYCSGSTAPTTYSTSGTMFGINSCSGFAGNEIDVTANGGTIHLLTLASNGGMTAGGNIQAGATNKLGFNGSTEITPPSNGTLLVENNAGTSFTRFDFGGTTSSFAGLCFSATAITVCDASGGTAGTFNSPSIGAGTPGTGAFTTLSASSTVSGTGFSTYLASPPAIGGTAPAAGSFTTLGATGLATLSGGAAVGSSPPTCSSFAACFGTGGIQSLAYATTTNCASGASPAVCGSAPAGAVAIPTGANPTLVVNTSAVTANSRIILEVDDTDTISATTCNSTLATLVGGEAITARTAGTSFTISFNGTVTTNPVCVSYWIVN